MLEQHLELPQAEAHRAAVAVVTAQNTALSWRACPYTHKHTYAYMGPCTYANTPYTCFTRAHL